MLPEKSQGKVLQATVVAVGSGSKGKVSGANVEPFLCGVEGEKKEISIIKSS